jgi:hypothetical protein
MSLGNTTETELLEYLFNATVPAWAGNGSFYLSLHTGDPLDTGVQTDSECNYGSYARVAVVRTAGGWTVAGNQSSNTALVQFPQCTSGTNTATHIAIGTVALPGAGQIISSGALNASLSISTGIQPQFSAAALVQTLD